MVGVTVYLLGLCVSACLSSPFSLLTVFSTALHPSRRLSFSCPSSLTFFFLLCVLSFFHSSSLRLHPPCHLTSPPSLPSCNFFLAFFPSLFATSHPADSHMQGCKWQCACVVVMWSDCGLFALPLRFIMLTSLLLHPVWTRLAAWLAGWMVD